LFFESGLFFLMLDSIRRTRFGLGQSIPIPLDDDGLVQMIENEEKRLGGR
jgi:hypothetical protein